MVKALPIRCNIGRAKMYSEMLDIREHSSLSWALRRYVAFHYKCRYSISLRAGLRPNDILYHAHELHRGEALITIRRRLTEARLIFEP